MVEWAGKVVALFSVASPSPGAALARDFAMRGATIVAIDPSVDALAQLAQADGITADLICPQALERARDICHERHGRVDALINCHTAIEPGGLEESSYDSWRHVVASNLLGPAFAVKAFLPLLRRAQAAAVVHIGSVDGLLGHPWFPSYSASKGGIVALTHVMAHDLGRYGIRVNCVARALLQVQETQSPPPLRAFERETALDRSGRPAELAAVVRFLASDLASYVTGAVIPVDGGMIALTPGAAAHTAHARTMTS